jgi:nucleotide-binding universal stress UspA family protein
MKKILIALDYNPEAQQVAEKAYQLATAMNTEVVLLHVMAETGYYSTYEYSPVTGFNNFNTTDILIPDTLEEIRKAVDVFLEKTKQDLGGGNSIQTLIKDGEPATTIIDTAVDLQADIIAMGSHSRRGLEKILMGSVAEKVLHHTKIPLFIIPFKK